MAAVTLTGWGGFTFSQGGWGSRDIVFFCIYLYLALLATGFRVRRAFRSESVPVQFLFVLAALKELSLSEILLLAAAASMFESLSKPKARLLSPEVWFHGSVMILAASSAWLAHAQISGLLSGAVAAPLALMVAASLYFASSTLLVSQAAALDGGGTTLSIWQETYLRSYPYYAVGAAIAGIFRITDRAFNWAAYLLALPVLYLLLRSYRVYVERVQLEKTRAEKMADVHLRTVEALASAVEAKDHLTHGHLVRVQTYSLALGRELRLGKVEMESLRAASILHDIGKVGVPERILGKPSRLTPSEFERVKLHTIVGAEIIERVDFPYPVAPIIRAHHERWDGKGYPDGLAGENIPLAARVLAVADFLDANTSDRQYRIAASMQEALTMVVAERGHAFDPRVVDALGRCGAEMRRIASRRPAAITAGTRTYRVAANAAPARGFQAVDIEPAPAEDTARSRNLIRQEIHSTVELSEGLRDTLTFNESLSVLAERLRGAIPFDTMALYVRDQERLVPRYVVGENARVLSRLEIPNGEGLSGWVAGHAAPVLNGDPALDPGYPHSDAGYSTLRSMMAVPLESREGVVGVLSLYREEPDAFTTEQLATLREIGPSVSRVVERAPRPSDDECALFDYLTGLPNARSLLRYVTGELARSERECSPFTVIVCAMGVPGGANENGGGLNCHETIRSVAQILRAACRPYDYVARWSVDRFALVLSGVDERAADERGEELIRTANETARVCFFDGRSIVAAGTASHPEDGAAAADLLCLAEQRMRPIDALQDGEVQIGEISRRMAAS